MVSINNFVNLNNPLDSDLHPKTQVSDDYHPRAIGCIQ